MKIYSPVIEDNGMIPTKYTCDGKGVSPPLKWQDVPVNAVSLVLVIEDPDANPIEPFQHWLVYNLPATINGINENFISNGKNGMVGLNQRNERTYIPPCPPTGTHRYYIELYALNTFLPLKPGATKYEVIQQMKGHVLATSMLIGKYKR